MSVKQENRWKRKLYTEGNERSARLQEREVLRRVYTPRAPAVPPTPNPSRQAVRRWMRLNASDYETATNLAEAANAALDLPADWLNDSNHWVWDEALRVAAND